MQSNTLTALDIWLLLCMAFVALTLIEFQFILKLRYNWNCQKTYETKLRSLLADKETEEVTEFDHNARHKMLAKVDRLSARLLLVVSCLCSAVYWIYNLAKFYSA